MPNTTHAEHRAAVRDQYEAAAKSLRYHLAKCLVKFEVRYEGPPGMTLVVTLEDPGDRQWCPREWPISNPRFMVRVEVRA